MQFTDRMQKALHTNFSELGETLQAAGQSQQAYTSGARELIQAVTELVESNQNTQSVLAKVLEQQEKFSKELQEQGQRLSTACDEMTEEISNQLYAFDRMRSLYEK